MSALTNSVARSIDAAPVAIADRVAVRLAEVFPAAMREIGSGADIIKRGQRSPDVFILRRGWAFTYRILPDGRRQILHFALPGEMLSLCASRDGGATESIQALSDVAVSAMPRDQLSATAQHAPEIGRQITAHFEVDRLLACEHMTNIGRRSARERIANLLLELFCRAHRRLPDAPNGTAPMPLTQNVMADALGLTSVHVNRTLRSLRDEGIVRLRHTALLVIDPDRFIELADLSPELLALFTGADHQGVVRAR